MPMSTSQNPCCQCPCLFGEPQLPPTSAGNPPTPAGKRNILQVELVNNTLFKSQILHPYLTTSAPASYPEKKQLAKMMPGGLTEEKDATPEVQEIANKPTCN
ncbi:cystatin-A isoform X2 [Hippopotamus amphibius kiboko]|uniref:cystatin-A isoform X2 n=1 Tax=Hippopotamus amphibius kiboko TaxID=575201 RepID=UPI00259600D5|nr:cystatin-A isoform X2 [Hippopotamus amphibius kiboko]